MDTPKHSPESAWFYAATTTSRARSMWRWCLNPLPQKLETWPGKFEPIPTVWQTLVRTLAEFEPVHVCAGGNAVMATCKRCGAGKLTERPCPKCGSVNNK